MSTTARRNALVRGGAWCAVACVAVGAAAAPLPELPHAAASGVLHAPPPHPFTVGERGDYDVKFGPLCVGRGAMQIESADTVRGRAAFDAVLTVRGGVPLFRVDDRYDSWFDTVTLDALRSGQRVHEGRYRRDQSYEIDPAARRGAW